MRLAWWQWVALLWTLYAVSGAAALDPISDSIGIGTFFSVLGTVFTVVSALITIIKFMITWSIFIIIIIFFLAQAIPTLRWLNIVPLLRKLIHDSNACQPAGPTKVNTQTIPRQNKN
jgi:hypothetical protein